MKIILLVTTFIVFLSPSSLGQSCNAESCYEGAGLSWTAVIDCMNRCNNNNASDDNTYPSGGKVNASDYNKFVQAANPIIGLINDATQSPTGDCPSQQDGGVENGYDDYPNDTKGQSADRYDSSSDYGIDRAEGKVSEKMKKMLAAMRKNATKVCKVSASDCKGTKEASQPIAYCWRYVKMGLMAGGYAKGYPDSQFASDAGIKLKEMGFKNAIDQYKSSSKAPPGAILVYEKTTSGNGTPGHIEVVDEKGEVISDFQDKLPIDHPDNRLGLSKTRKLIGIYIEGDTK